MNKITVRSERAPTKEAAATAVKASAESFIDLLWEQYALETGNPQYDEANPENTKKFFQWINTKNIQDHGA